MTWGAEDLATELGALGNRTSTGEYEPAFELARSLCLITAAAAGVLAIDTVDTEIRDIAAVEQRARSSRRAGYLGKLAIHPAQIPAIHAAFTPAAAELEWARRVLEAVAAGTGPERILVMLGYAGWGPGQLEDEISRNAWLTVEADASIIFNTPADERLARAFALLGINPAFLASAAGHA